MMNIKNTKKMSNNPQFLKTNFNPVNSQSFNNKFKSLSSLNNSSFKGGISLNLKSSIDRLNLSSVDLKSISSSKEVLSNSIKNKKLIKLENNEKLNQELEISHSLNFSNTNLTYSRLLKGMELNSSNFGLESTQTSKLTDLDLKSTGNLEAHTKIMPNPKMENIGLFMSLNSHKDYYYHLKNALNSIKTKKGKVIISADQKSLNNLINENNKLISYKIRHYLNLISKFNFKLSTSFYHLFQFKKSKKILFKMERAAEILRLAFLAKGCLISKPIFNIVYPKNNQFSGENEIDFANFKYNKFLKPKIIIHLFYYIKTKGLIDNVSTPVGKSIRPNEFSILVNENNKIILNKFNDKFSYLCDYLTKLFNSEIELELVRVYRPYQDSNILVQNLNTLSYFQKFIKITNRLFRKIKIYRKKNKFNKPSILGLNNPLKTILLNEQIAFPSGISGINIKLAGRPYKERIVPRFTVKRAQRGNFDRLNAKMIEKSMFTDKTKKGAFNYTVRLSHIFR